MKINNKKIIVPTLTIAMACALAGSIAGSVAWYQYSTRATSFMNGTTAGTSRNLQMASELTSLNDVDDAHWDYHYDAGTKDELAPSAAIFGDEDVIESFVSHPVYQHFNNWIPTTEDYFSYSLYFQSLNQDKEREELDLFLTEFRLEVADKDGHEGTPAAEAIQKAFRVELVTKEYDGAEWVIKNSRILSEVEGTTTTSDYLNLNKEDNKIMDHNGFRANDTDGVATKYKAGRSYKGEVVELGHALNDYYKDTALSIPAISNEVDVAEGENIEGLYLFEDAELTIAAKNFREVEGHENESGADLFLEEACENPAPNPLIADGTYYKAGAAAGVYYRGYTPVHALAATDGTGLYTTEACNVEIAKNSDGKVAVEGDYFKKNLGDGSTTYYTYQSLSDSYGSIAYSSIVADETNPYEFGNKGVDNANALAKTNKDYPVRIDVKVWLEGWQQGASEVVDLDEGTDGTGYYSNAACTTKANNYHTVVAVDGDSEEGLFLDPELTQPAKKSHKITAVEGENGADYFTDEDLTTPAENYRAVVCAVGDEPDGLYQDEECSIPVVTNPAGKVAYAGTYYRFGVAAGDYYVAGVKGDTYYAKGVEAGSYHSKGYIWDTDTMGSTFQLGLRFGVEADK